MKKEIYLTTILCIFLFSTNSCKKEEEKGLPVLTTTDVTSITTTTACSGGNVISDGNVTITERGVCYSTSQAPTTAGSKVTATGTIGTFICSIPSLTAGTTYYVRAYATNNVGTEYGNEISFKTASLAIPTLTTFATTSITTNTATIRGNVVSDGNLNITERGVCYSTSQTPTTSSNKIIVPGSTGAITCNLTGLTANTTYYVRTYATNNLGTAYGNVVRFTTYLGVISDVDNNYYNIVTIGTQTWMAENLKTTKYRNNDPITNITDNTEWISLTTGAYCWYENDISTFKANNGALYNFYAVEDIRNICPDGWHVPTDAEWTTLTDYLINNGYGFGYNQSDIGKSLASTFGWKISEIESTIGNDQLSNNSSNFTGFPSGFRHPITGNYYDNGYGSTWWSATKSTNEIVWNRQLGYIRSDVYRGSSLKNYGLSVRCLKDM